MAYQAFFHKYYNNSTRPKLITAYRGVDSEYLCTLLASGFQNIFHKLVLGLVPLLFIASIRAIYKKLGAWLGNQFFGKDLMLVLDWKLGSIPAQRERREGLGKPCARNPLQAEMLWNPKKCEVRIYPNYVPTMSQPCPNPYIPTMSQLWKYRGFLVFN